MTELLDALRQELPFVPSAAEEIVRHLPPAAPVEEVLSRLAAPRFQRRGELRGGTNIDGGSGGDQGLFVELSGAGGTAEGVSDFLKTNLACRHETVEAALAVDLPAEERRQGLGVYHPRRFWYIVRGGDGAFWSCSLTPCLETLRERFNRELSAPRDAGATAWDLYLSALHLALELLQREGIVLDCNPNNFGLEGDWLHYIDDDLLAGSGGGFFFTQALLRLREYPAADRDLRRKFLVGFIRLAESFADDPHLGPALAADLDTPILWPREDELNRFLEELRLRWRTPRYRP